MIVLAVGGGRTWTFRLQKKFAALRANLFGRLEKKAPFAPFFLKIGQKIHPKHQKVRLLREKNLVASRSPTGLGGVNPLHKTVPLNRNSEIVFLGLLSE